MNAFRDLRMVCVGSLAVWLIAAPAAMAQQAIPIAPLKRTSLVNFDEEILPILRKKCLACHSATEANGELVLETAASILKGGESGPAVVANSGESLLLMLAARRNDPKMPPPDNDVGASALTPEELGLLKLWIDQGARASSGSSILSPHDWRPLPSGINPIYAVAITPDGQFAACGRANQVFVYHVASGQIVTRLTDPKLLESSGDSRPGIAHLDIVQSLAFNPEGDMLASGGFRTVKLWRRPRDVRQQNFAAGDVVTAVAVSPDGQTVAIGAADHSIKLWDASTGQPGLVLAGHTAAVTSLGFSQLEPTLVSTSADKTIRKWSLADGKLLGRIDSPTEIADAALLAMSPPATSELPAEGAPPEAPPDLYEQLVTGGGDNLIRLWRLPAQLPRTLPEMPARAGVLARSANGKRLALANAAGEVAVIDADSRVVERRFQAHEAPVTSLAFQQLPAPAAPPADADPDAAPPEPPMPRLATASRDATIKIWNDQTGELAATLRGSLTPAESLAFHPAAHQLVSGYADGTATIWNLDVPPPQLLAEPGSSPADCASVSPDGKHIAAKALVDDRPAIVIRSMETGEVSQTLLGHQSAVTSLAWNAAGTHLVSGSADKTARVWDLTDSKFPEQATFSAHTAEVTSVSFKSDGTQVLCGAVDGAVKLFNVADGKEAVAFAGHTGAIVGVAFAAGNVPVTASADKSVRFWNPDGKQARAINLSAPVTSISVTRDGARLAVASEGGGLAIYNAADGKLLATLTGHKANIGSLAFSTDGTRLLSGSEDKQVMVWNSADGRLLEIVPVPAGLSAATYGALPGNVVVASADGALRAHTLHFAQALAGMKESVNSVLYRADGQMIFAAAGDGTVRGFTVANGQQAFAANHAAPVHQLALSPSGQLLASAGEDKLIKLWNAGNGAAAQPPQLAGFTGPVRSVAFLTGGTRLVGAGGGETPQLLAFDLAAAGALDESFVGLSGAVEAISALPEDSHFLTASPVEAGTVQVWPLHALRRIAGHAQPVTSLAAIAGPQFLSGSGDASVRHWNLRVANPQVRQMNHGGPVTAVAVRADGQRFASTSSNSTAKLWNAANGQQIAELKGDIRANTQVAKLEQQRTLVTAQVKTATDAVAALEKDAPTKATAAKTAADALAKANKEVTDKAAVLATAVAAKEAAEKLAIQATAAAQKSALAKLAADKTALAASEAAKAAAEKAAQVQSAAAATPADEALAQAAAEAQKAAAAADTQSKAAAAAQAAPAKAAADAAAKANDAAGKAVATNKPYVDALTALRQAKTVQANAAQVSEIAARESQQAAAAIPTAKAALTAHQQKLKQVESNLEAAKTAAADAIKPMHSVAFSPDGRQLTTGGDFNAVHAWDAENGAALGSFVGHTGPVGKLAYLSDDALVSGSADKTAALWNLNPGWQLARTIGSFDDPTQLINRVPALRFSPDGQLLCTGGGEPSRSGEVKIWKVADGTLVQSIPNAHNDCVLGVDFSSDGKLVASGGADKFVRLFDVASGEMLQKFEGHTNYVLGVSFRGDGRVLASCGADNSVRIWNATNGDRIRNIAGFTRQVTAVRFIGQSPNTISASGDKTVRMHNTANGQNFRNFAGSTDFVYSVDITPNAAIVVAGGHDSALRIWNGANGQLQKTLEAPPAAKINEQVTKTDQTGGQQAAR